MIFKLRMLSGETDGFVREYEVPESTDLLQLHDLVCGDLGYDPFNFSSFFAADSGWNKLQGNIIKVNFCILSSIIIK